MIPLGVLASARVEAAGGGLYPTYLGNYLTSSGGDGVPVTVSDVPFGDESPGRQIIIAGAYFTSGGNRTLRSARTIGGVDASLEVSTVSTTQNGFIIRAAVPTGTSGDVALSWNAVGVTVCCWVFSVPVPIVTVESLAVPVVAGSPSATVTANSSTSGFAIVAGATSSGLDSSASTGIDDWYEDGSSIAGVVATPSSTHALDVVSTANWATTVPMRMTFATYAPA